MLMRRDAVEEVGGFEEHFTGPRQIYEDQGFLAKLYLARPVWFSDAVWLDYRQHDESCVATVTREGRYHDVRRYFLTWFERYVERLPEPPPREVRAALSRALRPYRRPLLSAVLSFGGRLATRGRRLVRALGAGVGAASLSG